MRSLFDELRNFSRDRYGRERCAVHIGARSFSALALSSLGDALSLSVGKSVVLQCPNANPHYAVKLVSVNGDSASKNWHFGENETRFSKDNGNFFLEVVDSLSLEFQLGILCNNNLDAFSKISLKLSSLRFQIEASDEALVCASDEARLNLLLHRLDEFGGVGKKHGLDPIEMTRVEGMLRYSGLANIVRNSLAKPRTVDLRRLFPGIVFHGRVKFGISKNRKQLFVTGSKGATPRPESQCECADVGSGIGPVKPGTITAGSNQSDSESDLVAGITLGGPTHVKADSVVGSLRSQGEGDNGLFMPVGMAQDLVDGPFPGVRFDLRDDGFIGWKAAAFVDFSDFDFKPEPENGRFFVTLDFRVGIHGSLYMNLGKLGKIGLTTFSGEQDKPRSNTVKIGFYAVIQVGELFIKPVLESVSFGKFDVNLLLLTLLGTPFGTKGAVIGFIVDKILGQLIAWEIPIRLERELRTYMVGAMFPIMDAYYSAQIEGLQKRKGSLGIQHLHALYGGSVDSGGERGGFLFSADVLG